MGIRDAFEKVLKSYAAASNEDFTGHPLAAFIRDDVSDLISAAVERSASGNLFEVGSSAGQSNWARVPWSAVYHKLVTTSAQRGYYLVYLFAADMSGVYLSLNQGVTTVREEYGGKAIAALKTRAADFAARLGRRISHLERGPIDLRADAKAHLAQGYEAGSVCSRFYAAGALPDDTSLEADLHEFLGLYVSLERSLADSEAPDVLREPDEELFEDPSKFRYHRRIERNQRLSAIVKRRKGYRCEACGESLAEKYRGIGEGYIEAHHLQPLATLSEGKVPMDPEKDFAVLCANCHRMIHRSDCINDVAQFRERYVIPRLSPA